MVRVIINVEGGVVQDVLCDDEEAEIILVDWDVTEGDRAVNFENVHGQACEARVVWLAPSPIAGAEDSEIDIAIRTAEAARSNT